MEGDLEVVDVLVKLEFFKFAFAKMVQSMLMAVILCYSGRSYLLNVYISSGAFFECVWKHRYNRLLFINNQDQMIVLRHPLALQVIGMPWQ